MNPFSILPASHARLVVPAVALGLMALEYAAGRLARRDAHDLPESAASVAVAAGRKLVAALEAAVVAVPYAAVHDHRLFTFRQTSPLALVGLFLATELAYYWHHRASHRIRWLWATHSVHHSPTRLNFTAAVRLGWTGNLSGSFLFFLPLVWLGFRLFGTFGEAPAGEPLRYGLAGGTRTLDPIRIALGEWAVMARDFARAGTWSARLRALFAPPT